MLTVGILLGTKNVVLICTLKLSFMCDGFLPIDTIGVKTIVCCVFMILFSYFFPSRQKNYFYGFHGNY